MELRQLRYFVAVAEDLHFSKAAQKLFVSQPALSQQIALLENEIGVELFVRASRQHLRKVELTEAGESFVIAARKILQLSQQAIEQARQIGLHQQVLQVGVYKTALRERLVELLQVLNHDFPKVEVKLVEFPTPQSVQAAVLAENIDLGFTLLPLHYPELSAKVIKKGSLKVILSQQHQRALEPSLTLESLQNEKWVEITRNLHPVYDEIEAMCQKAGFSRVGKIVQEVSSLELLISLVEVGRGIAFISSAYDLSREPNIVVKELVQADGSLFESVAIDSALVYLGKNGSPLVMAVVGGIGEG
ncbi:MAG TPA: LysR substrate-binding domain-containing protein [Haliscomenobacter sp.]|uniref:LysR substrate-binding domain-containing protein n=1 Tax=Haliscomenobacter sp. TaxID=2717303 RepID=UPI002B87E426|nr:LysR substrate-binding domain-containing protein [Haliscomenobacter sp.]HOY20291.1 LysR substrate-binding domain-containing protein [Haliscomenobacter sp.]